jgi:transcriptional regulator with XRE-family HTH domain
MGGKARNPKNKPAQLSAADRRTIGETVRALRQGRKLSAAAVAVKAGVSRTAVYEIEKGRNGPGLGTLQGIARALEVTLADLVAGI